MAEKSAKKVDYKRPERVVLKISGELLAGNKPFGYESSVLEALTEDVIAVRKEGISIGIVLGGGNIFRGAIGENNGIDRVTGDNIGMLATLQNSLVLSDYITKRGYGTEVFSALKIDKAARFYKVSNVLQSLNKGNICFLACGTGNPYFTTDTAAVLRAVELKSDLVLKGTKVDGVYSSDPVKNKKAVFYNRISFDEALDKRLQVMDITAFSLARENSLPIKVFNINKRNNILNAIFNHEEGTLVTNKEKE